jgi:hypothetical protein
MRRRTILLYTSLFLVAIIVTVLITWVLIGMYHKKMRDGFANTIDPAPNTTHKYMIAYVYIAGYKPNDEIPAAWDEFKQGSVAADLAARGIAELREFEMNDREFQTMPIMVNSYPSIVLINSTTKSAAAQFSERKVTPEAIAAWALSSTN